MQEEKQTRYRGVSHIARCHSNPWKAQATLSGVTYHLGVHATRADAARAYDNLAYWAGLEGFKTGGLNFPDEYQGDSCPQPTEATMAVQRKHRAAMADRRPVTANERVVCLKIFSAYDALGALVEELRALLATSYVKPSTPDDATFRAVPGTSNAEQAALFEQWRNAQLAKKAEEALRMKTAEPVLAVYTPPAEPYKIAVNPEPNRDEA